MGKVKVPPLSAAVGLKPRPNPDYGPEPKNERIDVLVVQKMLHGMGIRTSVSGKCDKKTIDAIAKFQKSIVRMKSPDGVVDPNDKTYKKLVAIVSKSEGEIDFSGKEEPKIDVRVLTYKGTTYHLPEKDYKRAIKAIQKQLLKMVDRLMTYYDSLEAIERDMHETVQGHDGMMEAIAAFVSQKWAGIDLPVFKNRQSAYKAIVVARTAIRNGKFDKATKLLPLAQDKLLVYEKEMTTYRKRLIGATGQIIVVVEFQRDVSFAVAEVIGTGLLTARGANPKVAAASSAAFFAALKSGSTEIGEHLVDPNREWGESAKNILVDTAVATAASLVTNGIKGGKYKDWVKKVVGRFVNKPPFKQLGKETSQKILEKIIADGGVEFFKDFINEFTKAAGAMLKKGRVLNAKEIEKQVVDYIAGKLGGGIVKALEGASGKVSGKVLDSYLGKDAKRLGKWFAALDTKSQRKILADVFTKKSEEITKLSFKVGIDNVKASDGESAVVRKVTGAAMKSRAIESVIKKEIAKHEKKAR